MSRSSKSVLLVDGGLFQSLAHLLSSHFSRVLYFREWRNGPFPVPNDMAIGRGYEDIERVDSIMGSIPDVDLFIFPDIFFAEEQKYLRSIGKSVFGAGGGEEMELWREDFKDAMKEHGMPTIPDKRIKGITALREHLQKVEDKFVKVSFVRGLKETFHHEDYSLSKPDVDEMEGKLGAFSEDQLFMVEDSMKARREVGSDQIIVNGKFPKTVQFSVEGKDKTALSMMRREGELPKSVRQVNEWLEPILREYDYGPAYFSTEIREGEKDGKPYLIDPTCRHASPCGETYNLMCRNIGEIIEGAAEGKIVEPDIEERFAAQAIICADMAETTSVPIWIPPKIRGKVALYNSGIREDGQEVVVFTDAKMHEIGSVIGTGKTIDAAIEECHANAKAIKVSHKSVYTDQLDKFKADLLR